MYNYPLDNDFSHTMLFIQGLWKYIKYLLVAVTLLSSHKQQKTGLSLIFHSC